MEKYISSKDGDEGSTPSGGAITYRLSLMKKPTASNGVNRGSNPLDGVYLISTYLN